MKIQKLFLAAIMGFLLGLPAAAAEPIISSERLQAMAREADTPGEHAAVARHYRLRAEAFDQEAVRHEEQARKMVQSAGAMAYKWPAMMNGREKVKEEAVQARRAASESRMLADQHMRLAVEAMAVPSN